jgi:DNA-directed RNA polymerase subunit RPC12/RpoP
MDHDDLLLHVPVKCPYCGSSRVAQFRVTHLRAALDLEQPIRLKASCDHTWEATPVETELVRDYLGAWFESRQRQM